MRLPAIEAWPSGTPQDDREKMRFTSPYSHCPDAWPSGGGCAKRRRHVHGARASSVRQAEPAAAAALHYNQVPSLIPLSVYLVHVRAQMPGTRLCTW